MPAKSSHADRRFFVPDLGAPGEEATLTGDEAHHLARVLRLGPGDRVSVFDGRGRECLAEVARVGRGHVTLKVLDALTPAAEPRVPFSVVQGMLKGAAMDDVVRDATMVGAGSIVPVISRHVVVPGASRATSAAHERWRRISIASAKQCRRAIVPDICAPRPFADWLAAPDRQLNLIFVEPGAGVPAITIRRLSEREPPRNASLVIGPEGGWDREELDEALAAGCIAVTLGSLTLRAHTMALAAGVLFRSLWVEEYEQ